MPRGTGLGNSSRAPNSRIESAIGSETARSPLLSRRFPSAGWSVPSRNSVTGNGIFGCGDWRPKMPATRAPAAFLDSCRGHRQRWPCIARTGCASIPGKWFSALHPILSFQQRACRRPVPGRAELLRLCPAPPMLWTWRAFQPRSAAKPYRSKPGDHWPSGQTDIAWFERSQPD